MDRADVTVHVTWYVGARRVDPNGTYEGRFMAEEPRRPHRPVPYADLTALIDAAGGDQGRSRRETATETAQFLLGAGRDGTDRDRLVALADTIGIETLAELWRDCDPVSLPGALWVLYLLRQWCRSQPEEVTRFWREGEPYAGADAVVAGVGMHADTAAVQRFADAVLSGAYGGDFGVALDRAAAFFRVVAAGRRVTPAGDVADEQNLAARNERVARDLTAAAQAWRAGSLL